MKPSKYWCHSQATNALMLAHRSHWRSEGSRTSLRALLFYTKTYIQIYKSIYSFVIFSEQKFQNTIPHREDLL